MGLEKEFTANTGVVANYWIVDRVAIDTAGKFEVWFSLYLDKTANDTAKKPILQDYRAFIIKLAELNGKDVFDLAYDKLKETPQFDAAKAK